RAAAGSGCRTATGPRARTPSATTELKSRRLYGTGLSTPPFDFQWTAADSYWRTSIDPSIRRTSACVANLEAMVASDLYSLGPVKALRSFRGAAQGRSGPADHFSGPSAACIVAARDCRGRRNS